MPETKLFSRDALRIDPAAAVAEIEQAIRTHVVSLRRRGIVVGLSGGIDSSVVTCLSARALGADRVLVLFVRVVTSRQVVDRQVRDSVGR